MQLARRRYLTLVLVLGLAGLGNRCVPEDPEIVAVGTLERDRIELVAEAAERIVSMDVREGEVVAVGDEVARLDDRLLRSRMPALMARASRAEARLAELVRGPRSEEIEEARARLAEVDSNLEDARLDLERVRTLQNRGAESQSRLDGARARFQELLAKQRATTVRLEWLLNGTTAEELEQARADVAASGGEIEELELRIERLTLVAPRDGVVDALPYKLGERPPVGAVVAVLLADQAPYARVYVSASMRAGIRPGSAATVTVLGFDGTYRGSVRTVSSEAAFTPFYALTERDRDRIAYLAEVDLVEPGARELPTGLPVEVTFGPADSSPTRDE